MSNSSCLHFSDLNEYSIDFKLVNLWAYPYNFLIQLINGFLNNSQTFQTFNQGRAPLEILALHLCQALLSRYRIPGPHLIQPLALVV